jgi:glutaredoxin-related protein
MPRHILDEARLHPAIRARVSALHREVVDEALSAVARHAVVVLGMAGNPFVRRARRALDAAGVPHHDIDHGSYFSGWRQRNALKLWTGWPTLPMVFVKGSLVGGAEDVQRLIDSGELQRLLKAQPD